MIYLLFSYLFSIEKIPFPTDKHFVDLLEFKNRIQTPTSLMGTPKFYESKNTLLKEYPVRKKVLSGASTKHGLSCCITNHSCHQIQNNPLYITVEISLFIINVYF